MIIWFDVLLAINSVSKNLQLKDMCIDNAIEQLNMLFFLKNTEKMDLKRL